MAVMSLRHGEPVETPVDLLIGGHWIAPVEPPRILNDHALVVHDGRILDLLPAERAERRYLPAERYRLERHLLLPGLVNAHTHAAMTLLRGLADDLPLMRWLEEYVWPVERRWASPEFVSAGTRLAIAEMIRGGTTCYNDMYFFPDAAAVVAEQAGLRLTAGLIVIDVPTPWAHDGDECLRKAERLYRELKAMPRVQPALAPHAPYTVPDRLLAGVRELSAEYGLKVHMHVHETEDEVRQGIAAHGVRPLQRLQRLGLLNERLLAVHMTQLEEREIREVAERRAHVAHCPESNLKLASGVCPVAQLLTAGAGVALGTDGAASNNDLDMLGEMRSAALLGKMATGDSSAVSASQILHIATLGGARALGLEAEIGSLVPGKQADVIAVDLDAPETQPVYEPVSQLVYAASRSQVSHVWVAGRPLLHERECLTIDATAAIEEARVWRRRIASATRSQRGPGDSGNATNPLRPR